MLTSIAECLYLVFRSIVRWFDLILDATGAGALWFGVIALVGAYRFFLVPIFGAGKSDTAAKRNSSDDE